MADLSSLSDEQLVVYRELVAQRASSGPKPGQAEKNVAYIEENAPPQGFWDSAYKASGIPGIIKAAQDLHYRAQNQPISQTLKENAQAILRAPHDLVVGLPEQIGETAGTAVHQASESDYLGAAGTAAGALAPLLIPEVPGAARVAGGAAKEAAQGALRIARTPGTGRIIEGALEMGGGAAGLLNGHLEGGGLAAYVGAHRLRRGLSARKQFLARESGSLPPEVAAALEDAGIGSPVEPITQFPGRTTGLPGKALGEKSNLPPRVAAEAVAEPVAVNAPAPVIQFDPSRLPPDPFKQRPEYLKGLEEMRARRVDAPLAPAGQAPPQSGVIWDPKRGHVDVGTGKAPVSAEPPQAVTEKPASAKEVFQDRARFKRAQAIEPIAKAFIDNGIDEAGLPGVLTDVRKAAQLRAVAKSVGVKDLPADLSSTVRDLQKRIVELKGTK